MNETELIEKQVRWNISKPMSCVFEKLKKSKLHIKETKEYRDSINKLTRFYNLTKLQVCILCLTSERYFQYGDSTIMKNLSDVVDVPAMSIMKWKKEVSVLIEKGFLEWNRYNNDFQPVSGFCDSLYNNTSYSAEGIKKVDDLEFINLIADFFIIKTSEKLILCLIHLLFVFISPFCSIIAL